MFNKNKDFKRGAMEFDKMMSRQLKLESELELYKKIVAKNERDYKKTLEAKES